MKIIPNTRQCHYEKYEMGCMICSLGVPTISDGPDVIPSQILETSTYHKLHTFKFGPISKREV